jgi:DNA-binding response OmpR family regulator
MVDEDSDLRRLYADALARPGYCVDVAEVALPAGRRFRPPATIC